MECRLDKNKIKEGINDAAIDMAVKTNLFTVRGNVLVAKNEVTSDLPQMSEEQIKLIDEVIKYADDIKGEYKTVFESDPELFLYEIAEQAKSSEIEKNGALEAVGENIVNIALKIFPEKIEKSMEGKAIDTINSSFTREVVTRTGKNEWVVNAPEELAVMYLMAQPGAWPHITDYLRARYLSQFTSTSPNLIGDNLWLNHPALEDPTVQDMLAFMKKLNPSARVGEFDNLDRNGVALIRDYTILIKRGAMIEELPHEVSHFFVELLPDEHELKIEMMQKIVDMPLYGEVYRKYSTNPSYQKDGRPDINKIKREAVAQQIGEYVKFAYRNEADNKYGKKRSWLRDMAQRFFKFLRKLFHINSPAIYTEPLFDATSAFAKSANQIIQGDISNLNIKKVISVYDTVFFDEMENNIPENYEAGDIVKSMYEFTKSIKRQIAKVFRVNVEEKNMKALIDELNDPNNKDYNRIFDIVSRFGIAGDILKDIMDSPIGDSNQLLIDMLRTAQALGDAYRSMETIPDAIESAIKKMQKDNTLDKLLDNVTELQAYATFAQSFETITTEFNSMLSYIRDRWPSETDGLDIYDRMINSMGNVRTKFTTADNHITDLLTKHLAKIMEKWTDSYIKAHKEDLIKRYGIAETDKVKQHFMEEIHGHFTDGSQFLRALIGNFPKGRYEEVHGKKVNIERLKDLTSKDKTIFLTSSPTLMADPFLSNAVAYFYDKYTEYQFKGQMEAKAFADKVTPTMKEMDDLGIGWYEANRMIQTTQSFFTPFSETNEVIKRTLLSETNRFTFQFHKQQKWKAINDMQNELAEMRSPISTSTKEEIENKAAEVYKAKEDFNDWLAKVSYRPFTDDYYTKQALLKENKNDSPVLKEMKDIKRKLLILEQHQYGAFLIDATFQNSRYDRISEDMAILQSKLLRLVDQLPDVEKDTYKIADELYTIDEVRTSRLRQGHRNKMIADVVTTLIDVGKTEGKTRAELEKEIGDKYDSLYTVVIPKQEFYDIRNKVFDELGALMGTNTEFKGMKDRIDMLSAKERKYVKQLRDFRGDANMSSLKYLTVNDDNGISIPFVKVLKEMELEIDMLRKRTALYSQVLTNVPDAQTKANLFAFIDMITGMTLISQNSITYRPEDIQRVFGDYMELTTSQANQILSAVQKATEGDNTDFENLKNLNPIFKTEAAKTAFGIIKDKAFTTLDELDKAEEIMYRSFSKLKRSNRTDEQQAKMEALFQQLNSLYQNSVSFQYAVVMRDFMVYLDKYLEDDNYMTQNKMLHAERASDRNAFDFALVGDIEKFMGDELFDDVLKYMQMIERNEKDPDEGYPLADLIDYYLAIHKRKSYFSEGETVETWTPISYVKNATVDPLLTETRPPRFLTQSRVKDEFVTPKIKETDDEVINGNEKATVDMNGQWLPLPKEDSPYWNKEYAKLKKGDTQQDKAAYKLLNAVKINYLKKQLDLSEGDRLDLVLPSKYMDKWEQKKFLVTKGKGVWDYVRNAVPLLGSKKAQLEEQNYLEDIEQTTIQNPDIYTGLVLSDQAVKLRSARTIPLERSSEDAISSVAMFIEDMNEYTAKTIVEPIFKSFRDVFIKSNKLYPQSNKLRAEVFGDLYDTKILDKIPENILNNKMIAQVSKIVLTLTGMRLMMDIPGGIINLTAGELQMLIEVNFSKSAAANYAASGRKAAKWLTDFDYDFWKQADWSLTTQMVGVFNMIPTPQAISNQLSMKSLYSSIRSKMMAPRSEGEKLMAIQTGLGVVLAEPIEFQGSKVTVEDLYELGEDGIIRLKDMYKSLEEDWNPLNGKRVVMIRRAIMQFYTLLQGNYYPTNKPWVSYTTAGKWALAMKQWFASGFLRRMHGRVPDPFLQRERIGHHFAMGSMLGNLAQALWNKDPKMVTDYWNTIAKSPQEQLALRRSLAEFLYTALFAAIIFFGFGYDYDDKDKNKKLREMAYLKQLLLMVLMRVQGEVGTFIPLPMWGLGYMEIKRAVMDPIGLPKTTVDNIAGIIKLITLHTLNAFGMDYERELYYQNRKGYGYNAWGLGAFKDKGDSKLFAMLLNTIGYTGYTFEPAVYMQTFNQMQNRIK